MTQNSSAWLWVSLSFPRYFQMAANDESFQGHLVTHKLSSKPKFWLLSLPCEKEKEYMH